MLAGAQINQENPRRWLLVKCEAGVPDHQGGGGWWSVDHLVVDQEAVPTFVEVKRASDTRSRREVVAQMLEYVANGSAFWTPAQLRDGRIRLIFVADEIPAPLQRPVEFLNEQMPRVSWTGSMWLPSRERYSQVSKPDSVMVRSASAPRALMILRQRGWDTPQEYALSHAAR